MNLLLNTKYYNLKCTFKLTTKICMSKNGYNFQRSWMFLFKNFHSLLMNFNTAKIQNWYQYKKKDKGSQVKKKRLTE